MSTQSEMEKLLRMNGHEPKKDIARDAEHCVRRKQIFAWPEAKAHPDYKTTVAKLRLLGIEVSEV